MTNTWKMMYDLADQLYMTIRVEKDKIIGTPNNLRVSFGRLEMAIRPSIVGSHRHEGVIGVDVHVAGDFHIVLLIEEQAGELLRHIFAYGRTATGNAADALPFSPGTLLTPATVAASLRPSLAVSARRLGAGKWEPYDPEDDSAQIHYETDWSDEPDRDPTQEASTDAASENLDLR